MNSSQRPCAALRRRHSPRAFGPDAIDRETLHLLLQAARWAPSAYNEQPWRFIVGLRSEQPAAHEAVASCLVSGNAWAREAPLLLLGLCKKTFSHDGSSNAHAAHDLGLATAQLIAQATDLGLVAHPMGGFDRAKAMETFQIPPDYEPTTAIALGWPGDWHQLEPALGERELAPRRRRALAELAFSGTWGQAIDFGESESEEVLGFWFGELDALGSADSTHRARWWVKDPAFDKSIRDRFEALHQAALRGEKDLWLASARGYLATLVLLDQFPRNMYRDSAGMYASDERAVALAHAGIEAGLDQELAGDLRVFCYLPLMHSEELALQELCVKLFETYSDKAPAAQAAGLKKNLDFAIAHRDIVQRFGRFPHRNALLGRESTAAELAFLKEPGSSF